MNETFYDEVGGSETFARLVRRFYEGVASDPEFRAMYPEEDLGPAEERLRMFLEQYWGGPKTYGETRGHPRLRMRHAQFGITEEYRDRWLRHMRTAMDELALSPLHDATLWDYLERAAHSMVNSADGLSPLEQRERQASSSGHATLQPEAGSGSIGPNAGGRNGLGIARPDRKP